MNIGENAFTGTLNVTDVHCKNMDADYVSMNPGSNLCVLGVSSMVTPKVTTPGIPGSIKFVYGQSPGSSTDGVYYCTSGTNAATGNVWEKIASN